jgi:protein-disulfide isomerase
MHDLLYQKQDSLGFIPFNELAQRSGVPDLARFGDCYADTNPVPTIESDRILADSLKLSGTPAIIIDGRLYPNPPDSAQLDKLISARLRQLKLGAP